MDLQPPIPNGINDPINQSRILKNFGINKKLSKKLYYKEHGIKNDKDLKKKIYWDEIMKRKINYNPGLVSLYTPGSTKIYKPRKRKSDLVGQTGAGRKKKNKEIYTRLAPK